MYLNDEQKRAGSMVRVLRRMATETESPGESDAYSNAINVALAIWPEVSMWATALEKENAIRRVMLLAEGAEPPKTGNTYILTGAGELELVKSKDA